MNTLNTQDNRIDNDNSVNNVQQDNKTTTSTSPTSSIIIKHDRSDFDYGDDEDDDDEYYDSNNKDKFELENIKLNRQNRQLSNNASTRTLFNVDDDDIDHMDVDDIDDDDERSLLGQQGRGQRQTSEDSSTTRPLTTTMLTSATTTSSSSKHQHDNSIRAFAKEMVFQIIPTVILALIGQVLAGELLARIKKWQVFIRVPELFILVPMLLNLKGNLEMNLASRLSTHANMGDLDVRKNRQSLLLGNMALLQVQALIVSFVAGLFSFILGLLSRDDNDSDKQERGGYFECAMVLCVAMMAASISSAVLGSFMCTLVVSSRKYAMNPDNYATPIAASLGDLLTLTILGLLSAGFLKIISTFVSTIFIILLSISALAYVYYCCQMDYTRKLIGNGWIPILFALIISSGTGLVLQEYVSFQGYGLLSPVLTGLAGNFGAIFASRISTSLHSGYKERYWLASITLFLISMPCFISLVLFGFGTNQVPSSLLFFILWTIVSAITVGGSLGLAYFLPVVLWKYGYDPDIVALPFLSSLVDLFGQLWLVLAFKLANVPTNT